MSFIAAILISGIFRALRKKALPILPKPFIAIIYIPIPEDCVQRDPMFARNHNSIAVT